MAKIDDLEIVIKKKGQTTFASIPQLGLRAKGSDVGSALGALEMKKRELIEDFSEEEIDALLGPALTARQHATKISVRSDLRGFFIKTAIVIALIVCGVVAVSEIAGRKVEAAISNARLVADRVRLVADQYKNIKIGGHQFWTNVERQLDRLADPANDMPQAQKEKLLADFRVLAARYRPFVAEIIGVFPPPAVPAHAADSQPLR